MSNQPPQRPLSGEPSGGEPTPERKKPFFDFSAAQFSVVDDDPGQTGVISPPEPEPVGPVSPPVQSIAPATARTTASLDPDEPRLPVFTADEPQRTATFEQPKAQPQPKAEAQPAPPKSPRANPFAAGPPATSPPNSGSSNGGQMVAKAAPQLPSTPHKTSFLSYLKSKAFWRLIVIIGLIKLSVAFVVFWILLPLITRYNDAVTVPDITNKSFDEAIELLNDVGLRYEVIDSQYVEGIKQTTVLAQNPQSLDRVKPGRTVYISVSKSTVPKVKLPDVKGKYLNVASSMLRNWNLKVGKIEYTYGQYKEQVLELKVNGKNVNAGDPLPVGTYVDLVVSRGKGYGGKAKTPNFVGMKLEDAIALIDELGLSLQDVKYQPNKKYPTGTVFKQIPAFSPKDSIAQGSEVYLYVSGVGPGNE